VTSTRFASEIVPLKYREAGETAAGGRFSGAEVAMLTGCQDRPYAFGLSMALTSKGVNLDVIGNEEVDSPEMHSLPNLRFLNFRASRRQKVNPLKRVSQLLAYYARLIRYATQKKPKIFHILWNNKFETFDRTLLMLYYRMQGKKIALTVHNVNQARRDNKDSALNRVTLGIQYRLTDHIFVHTQKMKSELVEEFGVEEGRVSVIPFGINNAVPHTDLTRSGARRGLGIGDGEKTILFFGRMRPYKGFEHLLAAYEQLTTRRSDYRLIIASEPKKGSEVYLKQIKEMISRVDGHKRIVCRIEFIPDSDIELYFKAADVLVLPYKEIFQSGVMFLAYSFGLPVISADVGSFREEIIEGRTGFLCNPGDQVDLAKSIERYFASDLYKDLENRRDDIKEYAHSQHSWDVVANRTVNVYEGLMEPRTNEA
jgi:glycosyltransferase involved in cell wall biosynthesis